MAIIKFIEPHTPKWYAERCGAFTSSECSRLLKGGRRDMNESELKARTKGETRKTIDTLFGAGAMTYINEKVAERINGKAKFVQLTKAMQRGLALEQDAHQLYERITGRKVNACGLVKLNSFAAGTPDGWIGAKKVVGITEIKCLNQDNHSEICAFSTINSIAVKQLKEYDESFYAQPQMNMWLTGAKWCDFISYDNRPLGYNDDGELNEEDYDENNLIYCIKIIRIYRNESFIKDLENRIYEASLLLLSIVNRRIKTANKNAKMFNRNLKKAS